MRERVALSFSDISKYPKVSGIYIHHNNMYQQQSLNAWSKVQALGVWSCSRKISAETNAQ